MVAVQGGLMPGEGCRSIRPYEDVPALPAATPPPSDTAHTATGTTANRWEPWWRTGGGKKAHTSVCGSAPPALHIDLWNTPYSFCFLLPQWQELLLRCNHTIIKTRWGNGSVPSRSPCCVLLALSWNTAGGGDSIYGVVKCLCPYFTHEWAFLTNFFLQSIHVTGINES